MKYILLIMMALSFVACAPNKSDIDRNCTERPPSDNRSKEDILIIGDSISLGYMASVKSSLPEYEVTHNPCNGQSTRNALHNLKRWLSFRSRYKVITFNHGIWDIAYGVTVDQYVANLRTIVAKLQTKSDKLIFVTTTHLPVNSDLSIAELGVEDRYNAAAVTLMQELNVTVFDLNPISDTMPERHSEGEYGSDVHWNGTASNIFGTELATAIRDKIAN